MPLLEKAMAPHSSTLAWKIPWMEEPGGLQSMGSLRVRHDWATSLSLSTFMHWRRKWQPTPVSLPGESRGRRSLVGCSPWGRTESDMTEVTWQWHVITACTSDLIYVCKICCMKFCGKQTYWLYSCYFKHLFIRNVFSPVLELITEFKWIDDLVKFSGKVLLLLQLKDKRLFLCNTF